MLTSNIFELVASSIACGDESLLQHLQSQETILLKMSCCSREDLGYLTLQMNLIDMALGFVRPLVDERKRRSNRRSESRFDSKSRRDSQSQGSSQAQRCSWSESTSFQTFRRDNEEHNVASSDKTGHGNRSADQVMSDRSQRTGRGSGGTWIQTRVEEETKGGLDGSGKSRKRERRGNSFSIHTTSSGFSLPGFPSVASTVDSQFPFIHASSADVPPGPQFPACGQVGGPDDWDGSSSTIYNTPPGFISCNPQAYPNQGQSWTLKGTANLAFDTGVSGGSSVPNLTLGFGGTVGTESGGSYKQVFSCSYGYGRRGDRGVDAHDVTSTMVLRTEGLLICCDPDNPFCNPEPVARCNVDTSKQVNAIHSTSDSIRTSDTHVSETNIGTQDGSGESHTGGDRQAQSQGEGTSQMTGTSSDHSDSRGDEFSESVTTEEATYWDQIFKSLNDMWNRVFKEHQDLHAQISASMGSKIGKLPTIAGKCCPPRVVMCKPSMTCGIRPYGLQSFTHH